MWQRPSWHAVANWFLGLVGRKIVPSCIGRWSVVDDKLHRRVIQYGWRIGRIGERDGQTALGLFAREHAPTSVMAKLR